MLLFVWVDEMIRDMRSSILFFLMLLYCMLYDILKKI